MSVLDDLEEIAEQTAFGNGGLNSQGARGRPISPTCGAGHPRTAENTRTTRRGRRFIISCTDCDGAKVKRCVRERERTDNGKHVRYSARGYPL